MSRTRRNGFTIIELMVSTVVFSLVVLVIMGAIIQFGRIYYKGVILSRTQERARAITDDIARHAQFSKSGSVQSPASGPVSGTQYICAGNKAYTYRIGQQPSNTVHSLVSSDGCAGYAGMNTSGLSSGAAEMLGDRMQLASLTLTQTADLVTVSVRVVYGNTADFEGNDIDNPCRPIVFGGQFCAVSELTTTVTRRLK